MRENYVNIGRRRQERRHVRGRVLVILASALIIFALSLVLGRYLQAQVAALPPRGEMPESMLQGQLPADTSDASEVSIMASNLALSPLSDPVAVNAAVEELTLGSREAVSLVVRDGAGEVHFRSTVARGLTGQEAAGPDLGSLATTLREAGIYASAVFAVTSFAEPDAVARELQHAFEISLAAEVGAAGVDELLLVGLPITVDTLDDIAAYVGEIAEQLDDDVHLVVALPHEIVDGAAGTVLASRLSQMADALALDLRGLDSEAYVAAVEDVFADASLYFSKYNMRVLFPGVDDATFTTLRQLLEVSAVHNWQIIA